MIKSGVALAALFCAAAPAVSYGQVFLASRPHPEFMIGPLFVVASVSPSGGPVMVNLSWSLTTGPGRRAADIKQDLYRGAADGAEQHEVAVELHDDRVREVTCVTTR